MTANPTRLLVREVFAGITGWNVIAAARTPDAVLKPTAVIGYAKVEAGGLKLKIWPADQSEPSG